MASTSSLASASAPYTLRSASVIAAVCTLKSALLEAVEALYAVLDRYTLRDLLGREAALHRILMVRAPSALPQPVTGEPL